MAPKLSTRARKGARPDCRPASAAFNAVPFYEAGYTVRDNLGRIKTREETLDGVTDAYVYDYNPAGQLSEGRRYRRR